MTVLARRRDEIGEPVQKLKRELKRRELDDAIDPWPRGLPAAAGPDPGGGVVSGEHVADAGDATEKRHASWRAVRAQTAAAHSTATAICSSEKCFFPILKTHPFW